MLLEGLTRQGLQTIGDCGLREFKSPSGLQGPLKGIPAEWGWGSCPRELQSRVMDEEGGRGDLVIGKP